MRFTSLIFKIVKKIAKTKQRTCLQIIAILNIKNNKQVNRNATTNPNINIGKQVNKICGFGTTRINVNKLNKQQY